MSPYSSDRNLGVFRGVGLGSKFIIAVLMMVLLPLYWLLFNNSPADVAPHTIDIAALRSAAQAMPGAKPVEIQYETVAGRLLPGSILTAGTGLKRQPVALTSFRLVTPGGDTIVDSASSEATARNNGFSIIDSEAMARVQRAIVGARQVVFTAEDPLHVTGLLQSPDFNRVASKAAVTRQQYPTVAMNVWATNSANLRRLHAPLTTAAVTPMAPGVVLMRAPGHTVGSQMVFVTLADGREYLFCGDIAPMHRNLELLRTPSRLLSDWIMPEDRTQVKAWLGGVADLVRREPRITVVFPHDYEWLGNRKIGPHFRRFFSEQPVFVAAK